MRARLTGTVSTKAITRESARLPQNSRSVSPACMAPGTASTTTLSTTSMVRIDTVSAASATPMAAFSGSPARSTGQTVRL